MITELHTQHSEVLRAVQNALSILQPVTMGDYKGRTEVFINPKNIEALRAKSELISSAFCKVNIIPGPKSAVASWRPDYKQPFELVQFDGGSFCYTVKPEEIINIKTKLQKVFKSIENYNQKFEPQRKKRLIIPAVEKIIAEPKEKKYICKVIDEMKTVNFQLEQRYIDQIYKGEKVEDYRSISPVNAKKLCDHIDKKELGKEDHYVTHFKEIWRVKKNLTHVRFFNGYATDRKELVVELKDLQVNTFRKFLPEGMKPGTSVFTLFLGQIVVSKNFKDDSK